MEAGQEHERRHYLDLVKQCGWSLLTVINDILDLSRIEAGRMKLDPAPFQLREFLNRVAAVLTVSARKKGLDFSMSVDSSVPDGLVGDSGRLNQVLLNLAGNAIKFTETGSVAIHVECHRPAEAAPGETGSVTLCFSVRDTGIGIDPDRLAVTKRLSSGVPPVAMIESGAVREAMHHVKGRASEIDPAAPPGGRTP